jgi:tRNA pseudouridine38-40 synthase
MATFKLTLAYDGTGFVGWQRQAAGTSVQGLVEDALRELEGRDVAVMGAGRTDAGVHALGQVAGVSLERAIDPPALIRAINARLPDAVRVLDAVEASARFHARFEARSKTYRYRVWNGDVMSPFDRAYAWHIAAPMLDVEAMASAAILIEGRRDFAAFQTSGTDTRTTVREVFSSRLTSHRAALHAAAKDPGTGGGREDLQMGRGTLITYEITGDGFLRHMVRTIVGSLIEVGRGRHPVAWLSEVLGSRDRGAAGATAPAEGLFLVRVAYD